MARHPLLKAPLVDKRKAVPFATRMLKIIVGGEGTARDFAIHEALLTSRSDFFKKAMSNGWKEAEDSTVKLPDDDTDIFALYEQLVYTGRLPVFDNSEKRFSYMRDLQHDPSGCKGIAKCGEEYLTLTKVYILGKKLQDTKAKNTTIDAMMSKVTHESSIINTDHGPRLPSYKVIKAMYENTPGICPGRQILVDSFVWYGQAYTMSNVGGYDELPREFLYDLALGLMSHRPHPTILLPHEDMRIYHEVEYEDEWRWENEEWDKFDCHRTVCHGEWDIDEHNKCDRHAYIVRSGASYKLEREFLA